MNDMYGKGILKGLSVSLKRFAETYLDDLSWIGRRYRTAEGIAHRSRQGCTRNFHCSIPGRETPGS